MSAGFGEYSNPFDFDVEYLGINTTENSVIINIWFK